MSLHPARLPFVPVLISLLGEQPRLFIFSEKEKIRNQSSGSIGWIQGFEPWASRATIWRANQLRYTHHISITFRCASLKGFEPPTHGLAGRCSIQLSYRLKISNTKRVMGIEPTYPAWKAGVLPLNYTRRHQVILQPVLPTFRLECPEPESNQ